TATPARLSRGHPQPISKFHHVDGRDHQIANLSHLCRDNVTANEYHAVGRRVLEVWADVSKVAAAACLSPVTAATDHLACPWAGNLTVPLKG
ncbi:hypothetical protein, partial [Belnapia arida]|uniref:hypothetical protein n=1 Tax=Belnapia arida TaxID=2804533 RepID=UPI0038B2E48E